MVVEADTFAATSPSRSCDSCNGLVVESSQIISSIELLVVRRANPGRVFVFTSGCFELLHRGHVEYL
ncbi:MAG: hypothetical protein CME20_24500 [Gemmatimonadetes bacterium]|nr:hypothetical protein [Gemmatimonadota bacterium]